MMVLKLSIMASRAVDSQHTLVTVPVMRDGVDAARAQHIGQIRRALDEDAENRFFSTMRSSVRTSSAAHSS